MQAADPRYPAVAAAKGHYESFYLKAGDAGSRQALWLRYTVHKRPGAAPVGSLWATLFDDEGPHAAKRTPPAEALQAGDADAGAGAPRGAGTTASGAWLRVGEGAIGPRGCHGEIPGLAAWDLRFADGEAPFPYLPGRLMYTAPLPRTKALSLLPAVRVSGRASVRGREIALERWPGMVGHNWGSEHAERWIWLHGTGFDEQPDAWIDAIVGRIRIGRWTTPWVANGCLSIDGRRHRLGGLARTRATRIDERPHRASLWLTGADLALRCEVSAPPRDVVGWVYSDPAGPQHHTAHCAIADMSVRISRAESPPRQLTVAGGATYELGMREHDHGVPIEPFGDP